MEFQLFRRPVLSAGTRQMSEGAFESTPGLASHNSKLKCFQTPKPQIMSNYKL